jgi:sialate O-acetylesterase
VFAALLTLTAASAFADVKLPSLFSDHMVLQAGVPVSVWGRAEAGEAVTVAIAGQTKTATAGADGKWAVKLDPLAAGGPHELTAKGNPSAGSGRGSSVVVRDVLVGDVWLCSGQSNMAMSVGRANDFEKEKAEADFPKIRTFTVMGRASDAPQDECPGGWLVCSTQSVGGFSATAYFFGREIHRKTGVAVGLINSSVGGTPIEAWTSREAQEKLPEVKPIFDRWAKMQAEWDPAKAKAEYEKALAESKASGKQAPRQPVEPRLATSCPATLFNGKIAPLIPYAIRGAIWYQGEANSRGDPGLYRLQLEALVKDWRSRWGEEFPFAWVQLPDFMKPQAAPSEDTGWVFVRDGMLRALGLPRTGMAVALGTGAEADIHPKNKQEVGRRLAQWALADVYGVKDAVASGPLPAGHKVEGNRVVVAFRHADGGLVAKGGELKGFAIAGKDRAWKWAKATIQGETVVVESPEVPEPVAVRYAWASNPVEANLVNGAGLPASPFRTDDWPFAGKGAY